jgi:OmpA-OmpF porin, OOP family
VQSSVVRNQATLRAGASLVLWERLRVGLDIPLQFYADGNHGRLANGVVLLPPAQTTSMGDLRIAADVRLVGNYGELFTAAIGGALWFPTGDPASYSGDPGVRVAPRFSVAGDVGMFVYAGSLGVMFRDTDGYGDSSVGTQITLGAAAGVRLLDRKLVLGPEIFGDTVVSSSDAAFSKRATPLEGLLGAHYTIGDEVRVGAGVGTALVSGYGAPEFRGVISAEWTPAPEKREPIQTPISPDPPDRDKDGIADANDACPDQAGIPSDQTAANGCPAPIDSDNDGFADPSDACPNAAGVASSDAKQNGCPLPLDGDKDGIVDTDDACPAVAGVKTADPKTNGCPDPDRDKDGIVNESDACPDAAGNSDPDPKRNGCPKAFVKDGQIKILDQVKFGWGSAQILPGKDSQDVLEAVLAILKDHPEIKGLSIEGYSDSVGPAERNKQLSKQRANAVLKWLVAHGIDEKILRSSGFGPEKPIDTNETNEGRANNRRVEFHLLDAAPSAASEAVPAPKTETKK